MKSIKHLIFFLICLTLHHLTGAQPQVKDGWTPEMSYSLKQITDTRISPRARYIAYVVREAVMEKEKSAYLTQIHVAAVDGSFDRQFTFGDQSCTSPGFSPDGDRLAFLSNRSGTSQVYVMWMNGGEARRLTFAPGEVSGFKWSPDGSQIAYRMTDPETEEEKSMQTEKTDIRIVDQDFKYRRLYVTSSEPAGKKQYRAVLLTPGNISVNDFDWSPDGSRIVFSHQTDPTVNTGMTTSDISIVPADSGKIETLVDWPGVDDSPLFSPNGRQIAFSSQGGQPEPVGLRDLYTISSKGGRPVRLTLTPDRNASLVSWAPDGKSVYAFEMIGTSGHLLAIKAKGDDMVVASLGNRPWVPSSPLKTPEGSHGTWSHFSLSAQRWAVSFTYEETGKPAEVYYSELINYQPVRVTSVNNNALMPETAPTELIHWTSSGGTAVEGLLTYPAHYQKGKKLSIDPLRSRRSGWHVRTAFHGFPVVVSGPGYGPRGICCAETQSAGQ